MLKTIVLAVLLASGAAQAEERVTPPPIESFYRSASFSGALLSPNAKYLAVRLGDRDKRDALAVINIETNEARFVAGFNDADIGQFQWVNDERLVFNTTDKQLGVGDMDFGPGLYAVNRDGTNLRQLADRRSHFVVAPSLPGEAKPLPWHTFLLSQRGSQNSEFIYVTSPRPRGLKTVEDVDLLRLNTLTGRATETSRPANTQRWLLDQHGEPRIAVAYENDVETIHYRDPATSQWRKLASSHVYAEHDTFNPLGFGPDGTLYVVARIDSDKLGVHIFDLATNKIDPKPLVSLADYDFEGGLIFDKNKLLGVHVRSDADEVVWFDPKMKAIQETVDKLLPATMNLISVAPRAETPWLLVRSFSDVVPGTYSLFNTATKTVNKIGDLYPAIKPAEMGHQKALRYKARDGLEIPAWVTMPPHSSGKNLPMVVLVHGGPNVRGGQWGWHRDAQFLATRGYVVIEPEFRGSTGFGWNHYHSGWRQWGLTMQDDVADGARYMIAQGIADPKRICIAGASYGGYATLMGLIKDPDLFKCGIDWVGVTDINLLYTGHWSMRSDSSDTWKDYGMPVLVGDPVKDAAQLKATSPLELATKIKQPLILAYGGSDHRVPIYHGRKFYDAIKATNPNVEWIEYSEEGHGWQLPKNNIDFWTRVEKFLDRNIGNH